MVRQSPTCLPEQERAQEIRTCWPSRSCRRLRVKPLSFPCRLILGTKRRSRCPSLGRPRADSLGRLRCLRRSGRPLLGRRFGLGGRNSFIWFAIYEAQRARGREAFYLADKTERITHSQMKQMIRILRIEFRGDSIVSYVVRMI